MFSDVTASSRRIGLCGRSGAIATAATVDVDYPMNLALPPGYALIVGLGTTVSAGWVVTAIGGTY